MAFDIKWHDLGREPQSPPNPKYPDGVHVVAARGAGHACRAELPYPAARCGYYTVKCKTCGMSAIATTAGRPDDPRSLTVSCELQ